MKKSSTREKILKESINLFYREGFVKASVRMITNRVAISNASIYNHFKNKDEILYAIIEEIGTTILSTIKSIIEQNTDPIECLNKMIIIHSKLVLKRKKEMKIYIEEECFLSKKYFKKTHQIQREIYELYHKIICDIEKKYLLNKLDTAIVTLNIFSTMHMTYRWFKNGKRLNINEVAEQTSRMVLLGILKN